MGGAGSNFHLLPRQHGATPKRPVAIVTRRSLFFSQGLELRAELPKQKPRVGVSLRRTRGDF